MYLKFDFEAVRSIIHKQLVLNSNFKNFKKKKEAY